VGALLDSPAPFPSPAHIQIECDLPNNDLYRFQGTLTDTSGAAPKTVLENRQVLLRGCVLKNTAWCVGMVVYSGPDTKIALNSTAAPSKTSSMETKMIRMNTAVFALLFLLAAGLAVGGAVFVGQSVAGQEQAAAQGEVYLSFSTTPTEDDDGNTLGFNIYDPNTAGLPVVAALLFLTFLVLLSTLIPISLYVLKYCCSPSTTVCPQLLFALNYCSPSTTVCLSQLTLPLQVRHHRSEQARGGLVHQPRRLHLL
jgi:magnesium-transporting ATPase (P-type)